MKEFYLPIAGREENLDRACLIARHEAIYEGRPVYADFMHVPIVALPGEYRDDIREQWKKLFDQFTTQLADEAPPDEDVFGAPEPAKKWTDTWWGISLFVLSGPAIALTLGRGVAGWMDDWKAAHQHPEVHSYTVDYQTHDDSLTNYDGFTDTFTINLDEWKQVHGCLADTPLTVRYARTKGSPQVLTLTPECSSVIHR